MQLLAGTPIDFPIRQTLALSIKTMGYNRCEWLVVGSTERCGKQCVNNLCGVHRAQLRKKQASEPQPCRKCGTCHYTPIDFPIRQMLDLSIKTMEYNRCEWLVVGSTERCGKRCFNNFCGVHRAQLRKKHVSEPQPCRKCGKGTKAER